MTVKEMIEELSKFPSDMEVLITDGHDCTFYRGHYCFAEYKVREKMSSPIKAFVDIGIGGCKHEGIV